VADEHAAPSDGEVPAGPPARRGPTVDLDPSGQVTGKEADRGNRQFVNYAFFKLDPAFRRLPRDEREHAKAEFARLVNDWGNRQDTILRTYSLVGLRGDCDFMLWRISNDPLCFQSMQADINRSALGAFLTQPYNFVAKQKRSQYVNRIEGSGHGLELLPGTGKYLFIYPFVKTRPWYALSLTPARHDGRAHQRLHPLQGCPHQHQLQLRHRRPGVRRLLRLRLPTGVRRPRWRLRYTEASLYTQRDTPMFTCARASIDDIVNQLC
jgi:chlorite dismutase